ncbi:MAG TPA: pyrimidine dimer DNA glycosylase/endonuclease V [Candidatus Omnitrophota bacterium]|nr:pyrimidine dimer DNA glycosylase/endonuclease V [Candidatus Omnitrophota bacterium]
MRLWSISPEYLDPQGLVALWREGLLAQKVLQGKTRGYRHHPQLDRFKRHPAPLRAIASYLAMVCDEADKRGYKFDRSKIAKNRTGIKLIVSGKELKAEFDRLLSKLKKRDPARFKMLKPLKKIKSPPMFRVVRA